MHSSSMRTGRSLTVCRSLLLGGVSFRGRVSFFGGLLLGGPPSGGISFWGASLGVSWWVLLLERSPSGGVGGSSSGGPPSREVPPSLGVPPSGGSPSGGLGGLLQGSASFLVGASFLGGLLGGLLLCGVSFQGFPSGEGCLLPWGVSFFGGVPPPWGVSWGCPPLGGSPSRGPPCWGVPPSRGVSLLLGWPPCGRPPCGQNHRHE